MSYFNTSSGTENNPSELTKGCLLQKPYLLNSKLTPLKIGKNLPLLCINAHLQCTDQGYTTQVNKVSQAEGSTFLSIHSTASFWEYMRSENIWFELTKGAN